MKTLFEITAYGLFTVGAFMIHPGFGMFVVGGMMLYVIFNA